MRIVPSHDDSKNDHDFLTKYHDCKEVEEDEATSLRSSTTAAFNKARRKTMSHSILSLPITSKLVGGNSIDESSSIDDYNHEIKKCYPQHDNGSFNLLNACMMSKQYQSGNGQDNNEYFRKLAPSTDKKKLHISLLRDPYVVDGNGSIPNDEDVSLGDTVKSIVDSEEAWGKLREEIRSKNLVTSLGVIEACLTVFREEALKLKEKRLEEARKAEAIMTSKYSRIRRRLSIF